MRIVVVPDLLMAFKTQRNCIIQGIWAIGINMSHLNCDATCFSAYAAVPITPQQSFNDVFFFEIFFTGTHIWSGFLRESTIRLRKP
jgi:hypothetical protein